LPSNAGESNNLQWFAMHAMERTSQSQQIHHHLTYRKSTQTDR